MKKPTMDFPALNKRENKRLFRLALLRRQRLEGNEVDPHYIKLLKRIDREALQSILFLRATPEQFELAKTLTGMPQARTHKGVAKAAACLFCRDFIDRQWLKDLRKQRKKEGQS